jgi:hypothetical protein
VVKVTIGFGVALVVLGVAAYLMTGLRSWTALIPAIAGGLLLACGLVARDPRYRKAAMHAAVVLALLGFAGAVPGAINMVRLASQGERILTSEQRAAEGLSDDQIILNSGKRIRPVASQVQAGMAGLLLPYIALCVKSFIDARRKR